MIKKLEQRIFFVIIISLATVLLGIIILFAILNYENTINTATFMMDRFINGEMKRKETDKIIPNINIDGVYYIEIEGSNIIQNSDTEKDKAIEEYAIKASKKDKETGIIGKYIYKVKKIRGNVKSIMLMENEETIFQVRKILISSSIISILSLIMLYIIAKKVSRFIVKPVEETFEKQKQFISDASHELKTPLAVIEANVDVLSNEVGNNKWMVYIQNEIESMNKLINELLLLTKIENIDNMKEYHQFDISKEIEIICSMFESMAYEKNVKLSSNIQKGINMNGNKEDVEHILSTLIDNAIKHTEPEKEVIVELAKEKSEIILQRKNIRTILSYR